MRSKSRSTFFDVNARDPRQSASAHAFYPQNAGPKQLTRPPRGRREGQVSPTGHGWVRDGRVKSIVPGCPGVILAGKIAMSEPTDGILGNLPRSRPGVRSDKRASAARAGGATPSPPAPEPKPGEAASEAPAESAIGLAIGAGETVARTGVKVAARVAGGVLRRLPRP
jgi:hypothetical protein